MPTDITKSKAKSRSRKRKDHIRAQMQVIVIDPKSPFAPSDPKKQPNPWRRIRKNQRSRSSTTTKNQFSRRLSCSQSLVSVWIVQTTVQVLSEKLRRSKKRRRTDLPIPILNCCNNKDSPLSCNNNCRGFSYRIR